MGNKKKLVLFGTTVLLLTACGGEDVVELEEDLEYPKTEEVVDLEENIEDGGGLGIDEEEDIEDIDEEEDIEDIDEEEYIEDIDEEVLDKELQKIVDKYDEGGYTYEDFINNKDDFVKLLSINSSLTPRERSDAEKQLEEEMVTWEGIVTDITTNHIYLAPKEIVGRQEFVYFKGDGYYFAPKETVNYETFDVKNKGYAKDLGLEVGDEVTVRGSLRYIPPVPSYVEWRMNDGEVIEHKGNVFK